MPDSRVNLSGLLEVIDGQHELTLRPGGQYSSGENHGAFRVVTAKGEPLVLKHEPGEPGAIARLERAGYHFPTT